MTRPVGSTLRGVPDVVWTLVYNVASQDDGSHAAALVGGSDVLTRLVRHPGLVGRADQAGAARLVADHLAKPLTARWWGLDLPCDPDADDRALAAWLRDYVFSLTTNQTGCGNG